MMVPIREMTDVMRVVKEVVSVKPRQWVRLKRGIYKDDLAQVNRPKESCVAAIESWKHWNRIDIWHVHCMLQNKVNELQGMDGVCIV